MNHTSLLRSVDSHLSNISANIDGTLEVKVTEEMDVNIASSVTVPVSHDGLTKLNSSVRTFSENTDLYDFANTKGQAICGVRNDTAALELSGANQSYCPIATTANGAVHSNIVNSSLAVTHDGLTGLNSSVRTFSDVGDIYNYSSNKGQLISAVRNDTASTELSGANLGYCPIATTANGVVHANIVTMPTTFAVTNDGLTNLNGSVQHYSELAEPFNYASTKCTPVAAVRNDDASTEVCGGNLLFSPISTTNKGAVFVNIVNIQDMMDDIADILEILNDVWDSTNHKLKVDTT